MTDDHITAFTLEGGAVRGRIFCASQALDIAVGKDRYPQPVADLLAEALIISALIADSLKFTGRIIVQAVGTNDGAVSMLVAETNSAGEMRAYARFAPTMLDKILQDDSHPGAQKLMGGGTLAITIDQGQDMERYQSLAAIEGETFAKIVEHYFEKSEQIPTIIKMAVGRIETPPEPETLRGCAILTQRVANDDKRDNVEEDWAYSKAVMETLSAAELLDPDVSDNQLLYRLFHEKGVMVDPPKPVIAKCGCSQTRLENTLKSFDKDALNDMAKDGKISANCEYCGSEYTFDVNTLSPPETGTKNDENRDNFQSPDNH